MGGLASDTKDSDVADFFSRYGKVTNVKLIYHHDSQEFRGFGFVTFDSQRSAEEAADIGNGHEILGSRIRVNLAKYNKPPGRQQYPPHHQQRDFRYAPRDLCFSSNGIILLTILQFPSFFRCFDQLLHGLFGQANRPSEFIYFHLFRYQRKTQFNQR